MPEDLILKDNQGNTCLHRYAKTTSDKIDKDKLEKILNLDKCSVELFLSKNNDGDTFLLINPYLLESTLKSKYCTKELLKATNKDGKNIFHEICVSLQHHHLFDLLINHPLFDSTFLIETEIETLKKTKMNILSYFCVNSMGDLLNKLLESDKLTDEIINTRDEMDYTPLSYSIITHSLQIIKNLLNSKFDLTRSFRQLYPNNRNILMLAATVSTEILEVILNSKYTVPDMLYEADLYSHNVIIYAVNHSLEMTKCVVESKYWDINLIYHCDIDSDYLILHAAKNPETVEYLLKKIPSKDVLLSMKNGIGRNCSHHYAKTNYKTLQILLKSEKCSDNLIKDQDKFMDTCLHLACKHNMESVNILLSSSYVTEEVVLKQNINGQNAIMILIINDKSIKLAIKMFKRFESKELLLQKDIYGNNLLFYATKYSTRLLKLILSMDYCDEYVLGQRNNDNMTCHMYACKHNGKAMKYLLDNKNTTNDMLYAGHTEYGSCLTISSQYQPTAAKTLLEWNDLAWKIIYSVDNKENFLNIACKYNPEVVKFILESKYDLTEFIETGVPFYYACKYQPDAVTYILNSEYGSKDLIFKTVDERVCIDEAYEVQPRSLMNILSSKYGGEDLLYHDDEKGYKLFYKISKIFDNISTFNEILNIKLASYNNIVATEDDECCDICYTYKPIVIFNPCFHMSCVGCAFKLRKCHKCRTKIEERKVRYD